MNLKNLKFGLLKVFSGFRRNLNKLTWYRSENVWDKNADDRLIEDVVGLADVLLDGRHAAQSMQLVCRQLLLRITENTQPTWIHSSAVRIFEISNRIVTSESKLMRFSITNFTALVKIEDARLIDQQYTEQCTKLY